VIGGNYSKGFGNVNSWSAVIWTESRPGRFDRVALAPYPGGDTKARYSYATGANQSMQVVGWVQNTLFGQKGGFWNNDATHTLSLLEPLPGDWTSLAWGVNDLGQAVGESHPPSHTVAVLWLNDAAHTPVGLGMLPGDTDSSAAAINNIGQVIGTSRAADGTVRPFLWQNGQMVDVNSLLGPSAVDWRISNVLAINNLGQIVGQGLYQGQPRTFLMTPAGL
jgi:probable HAF family extracellular repeat protein